MPKIYPTSTVPNQNYFQKCVKWCLFGDFVALCCFHQYSWLTSIMTIGKCSTFADFGSFGEIRSIRSILILYGIDYVPRKQHWLSVLFRTIKCTSHETSLSYLLFFSIRGDERLIPVRFFTKIVGFIRENSSY